MGTVSNVKVTQWIIKDQRLQAGAGSGGGGGLLLLVVK